MALTFLDDNLTGFTVTDLVRVRKHGLWLTRGLGLGRMWYEIATISVR